MNRFSFSFKHFLLSIIVFSLATTLFIFLWYPMPYFTASGGWQGLKIAAMVDLVLGPLLSLAVIKPNKKRKELVKDFCIIILIQLSAFLFGMYTIYSQRPVANVFWELEKSFFVVSAQDIESQGIDVEALDYFDDRLIPRLILAKVPKSIEEQINFDENIRLKKLPPYLQTNLYSDLKLNFEVVKNSKIDLYDLFSEKNDAEKVYSNLLLKYGRNPSDLVIVTLLAKYKVLGLVFDSEGNQLETIELAEYY